MPCWAMQRGESRLVDRTRAKCGEDHSACAIRCSVFETCHPLPSIGGSYFCSRLGTRQRKDTVVRPNFASMTCPSSFCAPYSRDKGVGHPQCKRCIVEQSGCHTHLVLFFNVATFSSKSSDGFELVVGGAGLISGEPRNATSTYGRDGAHGARER